VRREAPVDHAQHPPQVRPQGVGVGVESRATGAIRRRSGRPRIEEAVHARNHIGRVVQVRVKQLRVG
jgi:hypothetical protein